MSGYEEQLSLNDLVRRSLLIVVAHPVEAPVAMELPLGNGKAYGWKVQAYAIDRVIKSPRNGFTKNKIAVTSLDQYSFEIELRRARDGTNKIGIYERYEPAFPPGDQGPHILFLRQATQPEGTIGTAFPDLPLAEYVVTGAREGLAAEPSVTALVEKNKDVQVYNSWN